MTESFSAAKVAEEAVRMISASIGEIVPPEAQLHLLAAQRELLLAIMITVEHNSQRSLKQPLVKQRRRRREHVPVEDDSEKPRRRTASRRSTSTPARRPGKIDLE